MNTQKLWTKEFLGISFSSFFLFLTFYILLVTLPIYTLDELHGNEQEIGLIVAIFLVSAVLCRPFSGRWIESLGRKKILLISMILFFVATPFYFLAKSFVVLLALRFFHGIGFGMATTVTGTIAADIVPNERRGEGMGYFATFMNLAMVIGPFLGLTVIHYSSFHVLFLLCAIFAALALGCALLVKLPAGAKKHSSVQRPKLSIHDFFEKRALPISLSAGSLSFAYSSILSFISVYAKGLGLVEAASFFFVVYAAAIILSRPFTGKWFDRYGENFIIYPSILFFAIGMFVLSIVHSAPLLLVAGALIGLGYGTLVPGLQTVALNSAPPHRRGIATATFFTVFDSGIGSGSFLLGLLAAAAGYSKLYLYLSIYILIMGVGYHLLHGRKKRGAAVEEEKLSA
ncbi:MFS transporter [Falsibacillus pallidus]|uniref:Putative MFS family arabinose efflux permease n=1 Tax=Falsibacillus pallidus TaxID=493781 RepID=A0A370GEL1_9BACI|nr:MFS transporter [Falsibacillus pallidus]RDI42245.1 putative MFS family arabinose efflux permease [Falsibacillus pallidus]